MTTAQTSELIDRVAELLDRWVRVGDNNRHVERVAWTLYRLDTVTNTERFVNRYSCAAAFAEGMTPEQLQAAIEAAERSENGKV